MSKIKSLTQFRELIETVYEIEFTLNNQRWLLEPDQTADDFSEKRELGCGNYIKKFKNIKEVLDFEIDAKVVWTISWNAQCWMVTVWY